MNETAALLSDVPLDADELLCELDREEVHEGGLAAFARLAWPHVQGKVVWSWHMDLVCSHLEAVSRGECKRLVINIPPGCSKSMLVSVMWPAWDWLTSPWRKFMYTSFDSTLSLRDAGFAKELIGSTWFQRRWGLLANPELERYNLKPLALAGEARRKTGKGRSARTDANSLYYTNENGMRFSTFFGGKATGWHAHIQVVDDPTKPRDIQDGGEKARKALEKTSKTWKGTYSSRTADRASFARVLIMQRLHDADLAADCIRDGYTHVCLPMEYAPEKHCKTPWGEDPRTEQGELLCPARFSREEVDKIKATEMSLRDYEAQYQQDPSPEGGALFQRSWFQRKWSVLPAGIQLSMSVDCALKDQTTADFTVVQVWGRHGAEFYLVDEARGQWDISNICLNIEALRRRWPKIGRVLIEDKAAGPSVIQLLRHKVPGIIAVNPEGGKISRANSAEPYFRAGNVLVPEAPWVDDYVEEFVRFPMGVHDDRVDATTQYLTFAESKSHHRTLREAMAKVRHEVG